MMPATDDEDEDEDEEDTDEDEEEAEREYEEEEERVMREYNQDKRWRLTATAHSIDRDPRLTHQWFNLWRMEPAIFVLALFILILSFATTNNTVGYFYIIVLVVTGFGLIVISFLQYQILAFFFLAYQTAATFYAAYQFIAQMNDVYICNSVYCNHGKKWVYDLNWLLQGFAVGYFMAIIQAVISLMTVHTEVRRDIVLSPSSARWDD